MIKRIVILQFIHRFCHTHSKTNLSKKNKNLNRFIEDIIIKQNKILDNIPYHSNKKRTDIHKVKISDNDFSELKINDI